MKTNPLSVKKLMKNLILRALQQLYAASEIIILIRWVTPPTKVENLQIWVFPHFANSSFFKFSTLQSLHSFRMWSSLDIYIYMSFSSPQQHPLIANPSRCFSSSKWMWSDPFPLYANINPLYSQILHVRSIWNPFKIFTVSLSAEEFANETLKFSYLNFWLLPLKPFRIPRWD